MNLINGDAGFVADVRSVREASKLPEDQLNKLVDSYIASITGEKKGSDKWPEVAIKRCTECDIVKTNLVHHCSQCKRCTFMMDHHCLYSNRCVGYYNMKQFVLFTMSVILCSFLGILVYIYNIETRNKEFNDGGISTVW